MTVDEYYTRLGLMPLEVNLLMSAWSKDEEYQRRFERFASCGDYKSTQAFYEFFYTKELPDLGCLWCDAFHRAFDIHVDRAVFPKIARFCAGGKDILDAGCGDGVLLCFLAHTFPGTRWLGVDIRPEAIELAKKRVEQLRLGNVTLVNHDVFDLTRQYPEAFDAVILRNVVDDTRDAWSDFREVKFHAVEKLRSIRTLLKSGGQVWLSLTFREYSQESENRLAKQISEAGFAAGRAQHIPYHIEGMTYRHLAWILRPVGKNAA